MQFSDCADVCGQRNLYEKTVTVGLSGGVDSAAAALMLRGRVRRICAATMYLYNGQEREIEKAAECAARLGIEHRIFDFRAEFEKLVISEYARRYEQGLTPNPCILCNISLKYGLFLELIDTDYLALGHYAKLVRVGEEFRIFRSSAARKDQSYNLYHLRQNQLARLLFPVGELSDKSEAVAMASKFVEVGGESMGACFLKSGSRLEFFRERGLLCSQPGAVVDKSGAFIACHDGCAGYTIGQKPKIRKAAGAAGAEKACIEKCCTAKTVVEKASFKRFGAEGPYEIIGTVVAIDPQNRTVVVGSEDDVMKQSVKMSDVNIISNIRREELLLGIEVSLRLSQWSEEYYGCAKLDGGANLTFEGRKPMRAPAPGQAAVMYIGDELIGGGILSADL